MLWTVYSSWCFSDRISPLSQLYFNFIFFFLTFWDMTFVSLKNLTLKALSSVVVELQFISVMIRHENGTIFLVVSVVVLI